jgi:predicted tellurium resistance membrane protein TerC
MFLSESVLITFIASLFAICVLNFYFYLSISLKGISNMADGACTILFLTAFSLLAGCLSGIYPALFLSD